MSCVTHFMYIFAVFACIQQIECCIYLLDSIIVARRWSAAGRWRDVRQIQLLTMGAAVLMFQVEVERRQCEVRQMFQQTKLGMQHVLRLLEIGIVIRCEMSILNVIYQQGTGRTLRQESNFYGVTLLQLSLMQGCTECKNLHKLFIGLFSSENRRCFLCVLVL